MALLESPESQIHDPIFDRYEEGPENQSSEDAPLTPISEFSPSESPKFKFVGLDKFQADRLKTHKLTTSLSTQEQAPSHTTANLWKSKSISEKESPALKTNNDASGARGAIFKAGTQAALFPSGISLASTWNRELIFEVGKHLAEEIKKRPAQILLAPALCLHRGPPSGRNFGSYSEDPHLTGKLASSYINGLQSRGVAATIKHSVAKVQETERFKNDSVVDEFSYNLINGLHADMKDLILQKILRGEWRYDGMIMSDWGGMNSVVESIGRGRHIEVPVPEISRGEKTIEAMNSDKLRQEPIEGAAPAVQRLVDRMKGSDMSTMPMEQEDYLPETRRLIRDAGIEGLVLLKNQGNLLPVKPSQTKIAIIGPHANRAITGRAGSAIPNSYNTTIPLESMDAVPGRKINFVRIEYKEESKKTHFQEAIEAAKSSDIAVVIVRLDAEHLPKDGCQDRLVEEIVKANHKTVVVTQSSSPVTMPWVDRVPVIIQGWYQGQEAGNALVDVLFGFKNPSGKLPITFPRKLEDNPAYSNWPEGNTKVKYEEHSFIGYRYYEKHSIAPLFPFGHGLSYTTFTYGKPAISRKVLSDGDRIAISIPITNSGKVFGAEIVQAYIHDESSRLERPEKELQAFDKVFLRPGETKNAVLTLDKYSVGYYDPDLRAWIAEQGRFQVLIGASSVDLRRQCTFEVKKSFTWLF